MARLLLLLWLVAGAVAQTRGTSTDGLLPIVSVLGSTKGYIDKEGKFVIRREAACCAPTVLARASRSAFT